MLAKAYSRRAALAILAGGAVLYGLAPCFGLAADWQELDPLQDQLLRAAQQQLGVTVTYDPAYIRLDYPNGDVPRDRGVCTDVVIRALRDAFGADLQRAVHQDMKAAFSAYPKNWGLKGTDRNIDHRRVPNLITYFTRLGAALPQIGQNPSDFAAGDIVTSRFPDGQTHIVIVTNERSQDAARPQILHNVGQGARLEDRLFEWQMTGHFRLTPDHIRAIGGRLATA